MAKYFFKVDISYSQKNKLFQEFHDFVGSLDFMLLDSDRALGFFRRSISLKAAELSRKHRRCKPIELEMGNYFLDRGIWDVRVSGSFVAKIYKVKQESDGKDIRV